ncbi:MAG: hypothetical protein KatS3mg027_2335 [Bacteroidia bacterium]|nr:MAG: hypothetical protein KatS3mg027_2335 [Bacteroidia bacterium]
MNFKISIIPAYNLLLTQYFVLCVILILQCRMYFSQNIFTKNTYKTFKVSERDDNGNIKSYIFDILELKNLDKLIIE